jgi:hypothetical protein
MKTASVSLSGEELIPEWKTKRRRLQRPLEIRRQEELSTAKKRTPPGARAARAASRARASWDSTESHDEDRVVGLNAAASRGVARVHEIELNPAFSELVKETVVPP